MLVMYRREQILSRVKALLDELVGVSISYEYRDIANDAQTGSTQIKTAWRNRGEIEPYTETNEPNFPSIVLLDGSTSKKPNTSSRNQVGSPSPAVFVQQIQIFIILMPRENIANEGIGEELSAIEVEVIKKLGKDQTLFALCESEVDYQGNSTDLQTGSTIEGQMQVDYALTFTFDQNAL
jgi:hypothetical protein